MDFQNFYNAQQSANSLNQKEQDAGKFLEDEQNEAINEATEKFNEKRDKLIDGLEPFSAVSQEAISHSILEKLGKFGMSKENVMKLLKGDFKGLAKDKINEFKDKITDDTVNDTINDAQDTVNDTVNEAQDTVNDATNSLEDLTDVNTTDNPLYILSNENIPTSSVNTNIEDMEPIEEEQNEQVENQAQTEDINTAQTDAQTEAQTDATDTAQTEAENTAQTEGLENTGENVGENVGEDAAEDIGETVGEEAGVDTAQAVGETALAASGLDFTPLGWIAAAGLAIAPGLIKLFDKKKHDAAPPKPIPPPVFSFTSQAGVAG